MTDEETTPAAEERVRHISMLGETVEVSWQTRNGRDWESHELPACSDKPKDALVSAMAALKAHALELLKLSDAKAWKLGAKVTSVSISYDKTGRRQYVLTVYNELEAGGAVTNTPRRREAVEGDTGDVYASAKLTAAIKELEVQAILYARGSRIQGELFPETEEGKPATPAQVGRAAAMRAAKTPASKGGRKKSASTKKKPPKRGR